MKLYVKTKKTHDGQLWIYRDIPYFIGNAYLRTIYRQYWFGKIRVAEYLIYNGFIEEPNHRPLVGKKYYRLRRKFTY